MENLITYKILEKLAEECASDYEDYTNKQKSHNDYIEDIQKHVYSLNTDEGFYNDNLLDDMNLEMDNFTEHKLYYYDENDDQIKFAKNKLEVKQKKLDGEKQNRSGANNY